MNFLTNYSMHLWLIFLMVTSMLPKLITILLSSLFLMICMMSDSADVFIMIFSKSVSALRLISFYFSCDLLPRWAMTVRGTPLSFSRRGKFLNARFRTGIIISWGFVPSNRWTLWQVCLSWPHNSSHQSLLSYTEILIIIRNWYKVNYYKENQITLKNSLI